MVELAFNRVVITDFTNSLFGLNVDGASVNTGIHGGLGALLRQSAEWLITCCPQLQSSARTCRTRRIQGYVLRRS